MADRTGRHTPFEVDVQGVKEKGEKPFGNDLERHNIILPSGS